MDCSLKEGFDEIDVGPLDFQLPSNIVAVRPVICLGALLITKRVSIMSVRNVL